ncbi:TPD1 protein homolog 1-like [Tasmannia lanceolata]|uniref:TPD1 protein homolog 1-like n=1 Tax=Tasmannia lanceolata TaxID=3420 RepID=UPI0040640341
MDFEKMKGSVEVFVLPKRIDSTKFRFVSVALSFGFLFAFYELYCGSEMVSNAVGGIERSIFLNKNPTAVRKLLSAVDSKVTDRIGETCSKDEILVYQGETNPLPNGIPTYSVQILNVCISGCTIADIHVTCGWFSSARMINPKIFRRISYDDCLVNDGAALSSGGSLSFQYANSFQYPLAVSYVRCY